MGNRSTDGITVNKVMVIITGSVISMSIAMASYVYTSDRDEFKEFMKTMSDNMTQLVINEKISHAQQANMDARLDKQEKKLDKLYTDSKVYWGKGG